MSGEILPFFGLYLKESNQLAMVKQNLYNMKQPLLGQKILEWRKAKGLTQEELVERCNINVRTIQRIEAGEVTPRFYTVKAILEVLEVKPEEMRSFQFEKQEDTGSGKLYPWLRFSFIAGILYLVLAVIESVIDVQLFIEKTSFSAGFGYVYTFLKMSVLVLFILFTGAFYKLGETFSNLFLKIMTVMLIIMISTFILEDVVSYWSGKDLITGLIFRSLISGMVYVLFASSLLHLSKNQGATYIIAGTLGILTGVSFLTVVFALPGLILLTLFEISLVVLLFKEYKKGAESIISHPITKEQLIL